MPTAGFRDHTESTIARQVNPSVGASVVAQLAVTSCSAVAGSDTARKAEQAAAARR